VRWRWLTMAGGALAVAALAVALGLARSHGGTPRIEAAVPVHAAVARRQNVPAIVQALGTVTPIETVSVQPRVSGQVMQTFFRQGTEVAAGAPLFLIDPRPYQAALDQTKGQLAHDQAVLAEARTDLARYQKLARENSIAQQQAQDQAYVVTQDQGSVELDQANVETAALNLAYCHIDAPASGLAGPLLVDPGNYVQAGAGTTLVTITQLHPIFVSFSVPQDILTEVRANQAKGALEVDADSESGKLLARGKLSLISNAMNTTTGTVMLEATFANSTERLWPDEAVDVRLTLYTRQNVVTVPATTVMSSPNGFYVYVIDPDDQVRRVNVTVPARQAGIAVIGTGLSGGETVVTDGQYRLANNVKVAVAPAKSGAGASA
jgi:membrane fusion protein, multidrug efflux system